MVVGDAQLFGQGGGAVAGLDADRKNDHVNGHLDLGAEKGVGAHDHVLAVSVRVDLGHTAADVLRPVFLDSPAGELVIAFAHGADVHVENIGLGIRDVVLGQDGLLRGVHAAEAGAEVPAAGGISGPDALDEGDLLRFLAVGGAHDVTAGGAGGVEQALVLQRGDDVGVFASAVLLVHGPVHEVITGGGDDAADLFRDELILHLVIDGLCGAHLGADAAFARGQLFAVLRVDAGAFGNGLRERDVDGRGLADVLIEVVGHVLGGALFRAGAAAGALGPVNVGGALFDGDVEVADIAGHVLNLGARVEGDVGILGHVHHLGAENAGGTVNGGEGLVELGHLAADGGLALHEQDLDAGISAVKGRLNAGDAAADNQDALVDVEALGLEGAVVAQLGHGNADEFGGLVGVGLLVLADPGDVLADIGHFKHVAVQSGALDSAAEGGLVHARGTGSDDHAREVVFVDGLFDGRLAGFGAGVH